MLERLGIGMLLLCVSACSGAEPSRGKGLELRIVGAQLVRGSLPEDRGGPRVTFIDFRRSSVVAGEASVPVKGRADSDAYAVNVGLEGQDGYWIVPTSVEDPAVAGELTWSTALDFGARLEVGEARLLVQAVDRHGVPGELRRLSFDVVESSPDGALSVELRWDFNADVDLLLTDPEGITLSPKNINSYEAPEPGEPRGDPDAFSRGGQLDIDSNAGCQIDGRRREVVSYADVPPDGRYTLRADLADPCGETRVTFQLEVQEAGRVVRSWAGALYAVDARETQNGAGVALMVGEFRIRDGQVVEQEELDVD